MPAAVFFVSCTTSVKPYNEGVNVIPAPASLEISEGFYRLGNGTEIVASGDAAEVAGFYAAKMKASTGYDIRVTAGPSSGKGAIRLICAEPGKLPSEGYVLEVTPDGVTAESADRNGFFYAMASLMQLFPAEIESRELVRGVKWTAPCVRIADYPRFGYRGLHLDPSRHFMSIEDVRKHIDLMAMFKLNVMHFHLTDDQGWRMEIKRYPELTAEGSVRIEGDGSVHKGYYTQEELRSLVEYASERGIVIIPEIEVPGHALAAISAYPELSCFNTDITPRIIWGVEDIVMCAGKEEVFEFVENVVKEVADVFPSEYIHIGGDECPKAEWEKCPLCQARIDREGLRYGNDGHTPEQRLQSYFIKRVESIVAGYGRRIIGWDEILEGGLPASATVMSWRGLFGGIAAASQGHDVIMTPSSEGLYLNFYQGDPKAEPLTIGGYFPLETLYAYAPVPDTLVSLGKDSHILGVQGNTWSEYMYDEDLREYMIYPAALAVAEIGWSRPSDKDFADFCRRLDNACVRLDAHGINYHIPLPEQPYGSCDKVAFTDTAEVVFTTTRPVKMVYTIDGTMPGPGSEVYDAPIILTEDTEIRICSVLPSGRTSPVRTVKVVREDCAPAARTSTDGLSKGLEMRVTHGTFLSRNDLVRGKRTWERRVAESLGALVSVVPSDNQMRDFPQYAAIASGYVMIPEDGIYYLASNLNDVSIDGEMVIDNDGEPKKYSRHDTSLALAKGLHRIEATFLGHIIGGWPSNWDSGNIMIRKSTDSTFSAITPDMLWH